MADNYTRDNIKKYYGTVEMPGGYSHVLTQTLRRIDHYYNGKFETGEFDNKGNKKLFFNITKTPCDIASKFTDIDTKNIVLYSDLPDQEYKVWLMQHDLTQWMKENNIGKLFNEINFDYPKYGHVFIKKTKDGWKKVNIHNLRFDPSSSSLETDTWFYEVLLMTPREIRKMPWNKEAVNELLAQNQPKYLIYECYDYNIEPGEKAWSRTFKAGVWDYNKGDTTLRGTEALYNSQNDWTGSIILNEDYLDDLSDVYKELKWEDVPGRRLGMGFAEYLFDNQIAENEAENLERKALFFKSLQAWVTRDENIGGKNVFDGLESGEFILSASEVLPLQKDNADLSAYNNTRARWAANTSAKTFSTDVARGENLPSRTPLGVANLQASMLISFFDGKKENFGLFLREWLLNDIIPSFKKDSSKRHTLILLSNTSGISKFIKAKVSEMTDEAMFRAIEQKGVLPQYTEVVNMQKTLEAIIRSAKNISIDIPDAFYDNAKFTMDINITGEQIDTDKAQNAMMTTAQMVSSNPIMVQNKGMRTMTFKNLEYSGVSPIDLNLMEEEIEANPIPPEMMAQGGSVSAGATPAEPTLTKTTTSV